MNTFRYKGCIGSIEASVEDKCLHGKLLYVNDLITYEAQTFAKLNTEFKKSVDEYLILCKQLHRAPNKPSHRSCGYR